MITITLPQIAKNILSRAKDSIVDVLSTITHTDTRNKNRALITDEAIQAIETIQGQAPASPLATESRWNRVNVLNFFGASRLPRSLPKPNNLETIELHAGQTTLLEGIKQKQEFAGVKVRSFLSKAEIFRILEDRPCDLTVRMANIIAGNIEDEQGLPKEKILEAIIGMERKFNQQPAKFPSLEVRRVLYNASLVNSKPPRLLLTCPSFLQGIIDPASNQNPDQSQRTLRAKDKAQKQIAQDLGNLNVNDMDKKILKLALKLIKINAEEIATSPKLETIKTKLYKEQLVEAGWRYLVGKTDIKDLSNDNQHSIYSAYRKAIQRLETMFLTSNDRLASGYSRIFYAIDVSDDDKKGYLNISNEIIT